MASLDLPGLDGQEKGCRSGLVEGVDAPSAVRGSVKLFVHSLVKVVWVLVQGCCKVDTAVEIRAWCSGEIGSIVMPCIGV